MTIVKNTFKDLTVNVVYQVKFSMLQRIPEFIKITSTLDTMCTIVYVDTNGVMIEGLAEQFVNSSDSIWLII